MAPHSNLAVAIDLGQYAASLIREVEGHVADMKNALRSIEDGSFSERAMARRPDAVIHFATSERQNSSIGGVQRVIRTCYRSIMTDLVKFLDAMLAVDRLLRLGHLPAPGRPLRGETELLEFIQVCLETETGRVSRDVSLKNSAKLDELGVSNAREELLQFLQLRNCLEHHHGIPKHDLSIRLHTVSVAIGDREITSFPVPTHEGDTLSVRTGPLVRTYPAGEPVSLTEADIEGVAFALRLIAVEIVQAVDAAHSAREAQRGARPRTRAGDGLQGPVAGQGSLCCRRRMEIAHATHRDPPALVLIIQRD